MHKFKLFLNCKGVRAPHLCFKQAQPKILFDSKWNKHKIVVIRFGGVSTGDQYTADGKLFRSSKRQVEQTYILRQLKLNVPTNRHYTSSD